LFGLEDEIDLGVGDGCFGDVDRAILAAPVYFAGLRCEFEAGDLEGKGDQVAEFSDVVVFLMEHEHNLLGDVFGDLPPITRCRERENPFTQCRKHVHNVRIRETPMEMTRSLKERGVRLTRQRQVLLDLIDKSGQHLDAETLYTRARESDPKLNRVTVYRTLKMLKESGLVDELDLLHKDGDQHYYETRMKREHAHVICLKCGKVEEYFGEPLARLRKEVEETFGFEIRLVRTEIGGYCSHCQAMRTEEMEAAKLV